MKLHYIAIKKLISLYNSDIINNNKIMEGLRRQNGISNRISDKYTIQYIHMTFKDLDLSRRARNLIARGLLITNPN